MSESKNTPGPWRISRTSGMEIFINHDHDQPNRVAGYFAEVRRFTSDNEQVEANAKLIASAPDLLDALRLIASAKDRDFGIDYAIGCAKAAIRKATGEKQ